MYYKMNTRHMKRDGKDSFESVVRKTCEGKGYG